MSLAHKAVSAFTAALGMLLAPRALALVILQYHHIADDTPELTSTSPAVFARHLEIIAESGFRVVSLAEVVEGLRAGREPPPDSVLLTFDDAYLDIYQNALPLLKKYQWPFVVFVNSQPLAERNAEQMTWRQLRELRAAGAAIANHTHSHLHMIRRPQAVPEEQWHERLTAEIERAETAIDEHTGQSFKVLSYPYGEFDAGLRALLEKKGFLGFGQHSGAVARGQTTDIPRFPMGGRFADPEEFATKLRTLPLPVAEVALFSAEGEPLRDGVLPLAGRRPRLVITLETQAVAEGLRCYFSGQGEAVAEREGNRVTVTPKGGLGVGRSRVNCTAPAGQGRYFWYSMPFFGRDDQGQWPAEP